MKQGPTNSAPAYVQLLLDQERERLALEQRHAHERAGARSIIRKAMRETPGLPLWMR